MERPSMKKEKKKQLINYLPKAASPVNFRSPTLSPVQRANSAAARFSRPGVSIIPAEARRRTTKTSSRGSAHEPTSPEVSCIGTIKLRKDKRKKKKISKKMIELIIELTNFKLFGSKAGEIGNGKSDDRGGCEEGVAEECSAALNRGLVPPLGQIKRFASRDRRGSADFDWAAQVAPVNESDEKIESGEKEVDEGRNELNAERKRENDLWRRRNFNLRLPLQTGSQQKMMLVSGFD